MIKDISGKELMARNFKTNERNLTETIPAFYMKKKV